MLLKKAATADLEHRRIVFYEVGLFFALMLTLLAFEWNFKKESGAIAFSTGKIIDDIIEVIPTTQPETPKVEVQPLQVNSDVIRIVPNSVPLDNSLVLPSEDFGTAVEVRPMIAPKVEEVATDEFFYFVEQMPSFQNGGIDAFQKYVLKNIVYDENAAANNIFGTVIVEFVVNTDGSVGDIKVLRSVDKNLDNEVIRVLKKSPAWTPGYQRDKAVRVKYTLPVTFKLNS